MAEGPCHQAQCLGHWSWPRVRVLFTTSPQEQAQAGGASQHSSHTQEMWPRPQPGTSQRCQVGVPPLHDQETESLRHP